MMKARKTDHLRISAKEDVEAGDSGLGRIRLQHKASPQMRFADVDTTVRFLGKDMAFPLIFEAITGGTPEAGKINRTLAKVAQKHGLGMGVGSQRAAIEDPKLASTYQVRELAPDILLLGNLGAVQLNYGYGLEECKAAVEMLQADALALHLNPLQEAVQPEGDTDFRGIIGKINKAAAGMRTPVIAKEVGCGLDYDTAKALKVAAYDCGGLGGTSWSLVESYRNPSLMGEVGALYSDWGIPTAEAVAELSRLKKPLIASGGVRTGLDGAKCVALGANVVGVALPVLRAYYSGGQKAVDRFAERFIAEFKTAMFLTGSSKVSDLTGRVRR
ncbi:MAG: type 2 isopentenyl-diphosphate Delta-isomerase [Candidatus Altiarchaeota archaeon]